VFFKQCFGSIFSNLIFAQEPSNSQSLEFETVEIISRDNIIPSADLKNKYLDFAKQHGWKESGNSATCMKINIPWIHNIELTVFSNKTLKIGYTKIGIFCKYFSQIILSDAKNNNNKVIVVYDSVTGEKNIIQEPSNSQSLEFETVEIISRDNIIPSAEIQPLIDNFTSCAPLIFCTTRPCRSTLDLDIGMSINVIFL
jgi:hypothetical protein